MRAGQERDGTVKRRTSSVSNFFRRKLSISRGGSATRRTHSERRKGGGGGGGGGGGTDVAIMVRATVRGEREVVELLTQWWWGNTQPVTNVERGKEVGYNCLHSGGGVIPSQ